MKSNKYFRLAIYMFLSLFITTSFINGTNIKNIQRINLTGQRRGPKKIPDIFIGVNADIKRRSSGQYWYKRHAQQLIKSDRLKRNNIADTHAQKNRDQGAIGKNQHRQNNNHRRYIKKAQVIYRYKVIDPNDLHGSDNYRKDKNSKRVKQSQNHNF